MGKDTLKLVMQRDQAELIIDKVMDTDVGYPSPSALESVKQLVVNFVNVRILRSVGIKDFVNFIQEVKKLKGVEIIYKNCPPMIPEFCNDVVIRSIMAPFYCEACDEECSKLFLTENIDKQAVQRFINGQTCPVCERPLSFDEPETSFFSFLPA